MCPESRGPWDLRIFAGVSSEGEDCPFLKRPVACLGSAMWSGHLCSGPASPVPPSPALAWHPVKSSENVCQGEMHQKTLVSPSEHNVGSRLTNISVHHQLRQITRPDLFCLDATFSFPYSPFLGRLSLHTLMGENVNPINFKFSS